MYPWQDFAILALLQIGISWIEIGLYAKCRHQQLLGAMRNWMECYLFGSTAKGNIEQTTRDLPKEHLQNDLLVMRVILPYVFDHKLHDPDVAVS